MSVELLNDEGTKMIDCREAAKRYGCTMRYIRKLALEGKLPHKVIGGAYLFPIEAVDAVRKEAARGEGRHRKRAEGFRAG
jgi:excisionase family DNA binding protein